MTAAGLATDRNFESPVQERTQGQPTELVAPDCQHDAHPAWESPYDRLERNWNDLVVVANRAGLPLPLVRGNDQMIRRAQHLAHHPELPL